jgi:ATP-dependent DNA helicase RecG
MSGITVTKLSNEEVAKLLAMQESHFCDVKAIELTPAKLTRSIAAFSNAEGGELFIGIDEEKSTSTLAWRGFDSPEEANGHLQAFEQMFPLGTDYQYDFLSNESQSGLVLKVQIAKTRDIKTASDGKVYNRRGAQNQSSHVFMARDLFYHEGRCWPSYA